RRRHTRFDCDWSSDVCSSDLKVLKNVKKAEPLPPLPLQKRFTEPKRIQQSYPIDEDETLQDKTLIAFGWLTCHILEQEELLALRSEERRVGKECRSWSVRNVL